MPQDLATDPLVPGYRFNIEDAHNAIPALSLLDLR